VIRASSIPIERRGKTFARLKFGMSRAEKHTTLTIKTLSSMTIDRIKITNTNVVNWYCECIWKERWDSPIGKVLEEAVSYGE
jgi:hypothetical protein